MMANWLKLAKRWFVWILPLGLALAGCKPAPGDEALSKTKSDPDRVVEAAAPGTNGDHAASAPSTNTAAPAKQPEVKSEASKLPEPVVTGAGQLQDVVVNEYYEDEDYGFKVAYPGENWRRGGPGVLMTPGELCRVWSSPFSQDQEIMVLVRLEGRESSPEQLMDELPRQFVAQAHATVNHTSYLQIAGKKAVQIWVSGAGVGFALDGKGPVPTSQRWVVVPRGKDLLCFLVTAPTAEFGVANRVFQMMLPTIEIADHRPSAEANLPDLYVDKEYGFKVPYPADGWTRGGPPPGSVFVPGELCRAWSKSSNRSELISVFIQRVGKATTPRELLDDSVKSMRENLGAEVMEQQIKSVANMQAASIVITGAGTGSALNGKGPIKTTQHWVAIPREQDVVVFLANGPADKFNEVEMTLQEMLRGMEIVGFQNEAQRAAK